MRHMELEMENLQHEDLDLARGKESSIWALKLYKELRKKNEISVNLPPTAPNLKKIKFKTFHLLFCFF